MALAGEFQLTRKILLHLKCLFWCLHQMHTRYDLNLVLYSLEHRSIHPEIKDSNLGDNLAFLMEHLEEKERLRLAEALQKTPESIASMDISDKHFELGHYIQSMADFGPIKAGTYGIISCISPQLRGLFLIEEQCLIEIPIPPATIQTIFGTYIV